tara:strand:- start:163 stop:456 length:294 start_codon:yes stop_codon:yes gene_type:complete
MAQSIEEIKAELEAPTHRVVNGVQVDLTVEEIEATLNTWAENERAKQLDEEANGWLYGRLAEYPSLQDCIHALLDGGDTLTDLQAARQAVKDKYPKG